MIFDESVRELMAKVGRETAANPLQEKILHLQWELHNLTGENPPVIELQRLRRAGDRVATSEAGGRTPEAGDRPAKPADRQAAAQR